MWASLYPRGFKLIPVYKIPVIWIGPVGLWVARMLKFNPPICGGNTVTALKRGSVFCKESLINCNSLNILMCVIAVDICYNAEWIKIISVRWYKARNHRLIDAFLLLAAVRVPIGTACG
jgi:hypothetical protein